MATRQKLGPKIKRRNKPSKSVMARRKAVKRNTRYQAGKFFRPKLMVSGGKVYASPQSGGSYTVNPRRMYMKRKRKKASKSRRRYRRNPAGRGIIKQAFSRKHIIGIASLGVGFVGGIKAQKYINNMEALMRFRRFTGLIPFILGTVLAVRAKNDAVKSVGAGLSLSGLYDLATQNIPQLQLSPVEGVDLDDDSAYGTAIDVDGTAIDVEGDEDVLVGEDDVELVGAGSPYAMV